VAVLDPRLGEAFNISQLLEERAGQRTTQVDLPFDTVTIAEPQHLFTHMSESHEPWKPIVNHASSHAPPSVRSASEPSQVRSAMLSR
jgi:hypothetical protein